jgi:hypothetical protein
MTITRCWKALGGEIAIADDLVCRGCDKQLTEAPTADTAPGADHPVVDQSAFRVLSDELSIILASSDPAIPAQSRFELCGDDLAALWSAMSNAIDSANRTQLQAVERGSP